MTAPGTADAADPVGRALRQHWDVIVVGTGMGGATLGHRLAMAGRKVLFCEQGRSHLAGTAALRGRYPEMANAPAGDVLDARHAELLRSAGRNVAAVNVPGTPPSAHFIPFIGAGSGGSSALYGMALERFSPLDFRPRANHPNAVDSTLDEAWPLSHASLTPYYAAAERLYGVRGTADPLAPARADAHQLRQPPSMTPGAAELFAFLQRRQLHPYRLPQACEFKPGCQGCQGYLCPSDCKNDSARTCLAPALAQHGATLLDECEVLRVNASRERVEGLVCERRGQRFTLRAGLVVLAAGALKTPGILLRSASAEWPRGLANASGLVGRNLMRHFIDLYLVRPDVQLPAGFDNRFKELSFNDFNLSDGMKLGSVQSFGRLPPAAMLFGSMLQDLRDSAWRPLAPLAPLAALARPLLRPVLEGIESGHTALASTIEDLPYADNRVSLRDSGGGIAVAYRIRPEGRQRIDHFRQLMRELLKSRRVRRIDQAANIQRIAHACGTCRFGSDPASSVLDADNRAHGIDNLLVVDASFFPSSGGTNPGLTIAANALRVADTLQN